MNVSRYLKQIIFLCISACMVLLSLTCINYQYRPFSVSLENLMLICIMGVGWVTVVVISIVDKNI